MKRFPTFISSLSVALGLVLVFFGAIAQSQPRTGKVYTVAEQEPEFPGGKAALGRYLAENIQIPGVLVRKNYSPESIAAKFIVDELGYVQDVRVTTKPLDKKMQKGMEAFMANIIAAVEKMPRWEPGEVGGKRVAVFYTLPIEVNMR